MGPIINHIDADTPLDSSTIDPVNIRDCLPIFVFCHKKKFVQSKVKFLFELLKIESGNLKNKILSDVVSCLAYNGRVRRAWASQPVTNSVELPNLNIQKFNRTNLI